MIESLLTCFTCISFSLYGHIHQFLPKNLVGRLIPQNRVLGRITRFYNPAGESVSLGASSQTDIWDKYLEPFWDNPVETSAGAELSRGSLWLEYRAAEYADIIKGLSPT